MHKLLIDLARAAELHGPLIISKSGLEKYANSIIGECVALICSSKPDESREQLAESIKRHFGISG